MFRHIPNLIGITDYIYPCTIWVTGYKVNVPFFEHIVTSLTKLTLFQDNHCRWMTKSSTCTCVILPFFNISRWMYWYCHVSRRYYKDRKIHAKANNLEKLGQISERFLLPVFWLRFKLPLVWQVVANSGGQVPEQKSWLLFAVLFTPRSSIVFNTQWGLISVQGV